MTTTIWAPAEVLEVRVELGPAEQAGVMETLVLRALRAGMVTVHQLAGLVGVPPRIMLDLIGDLWRSGKIEVDVGFEHELIRLSPDGAALLRDIGEEQDADGSGRVLHTTEVLLEKLTGRVLPIRAARGRVDRALRVPNLEGSRELADVRASELGGAVEGNLRDRDEDADRFAGRRIIGAHVVPAPLRRASGLRYVPIEFEVGLDGDQLSFRAADSSLTLEQGEIAARRLSGAVAAAPNSGFSRELRAKYSAGRLAPAGSPQQKADDLLRAVRGLTDAAPPNRQREHDRLTLMASQLLQLADDRAERTLQTRLLISRADHDAEILRLIQVAKRQLVIAVPWIRAQGIRTFSSALSDAVGRGVTVLLLWGVERQGGELPADVIDELNEIQRVGRRADRGGRIAYHRNTSAHVHAKVILADDRHALVTSRNYFSGSGHDEVGVVIDAVEGRRSRVHEELLKWASSVTPSTELHALLIQHGEDFGEPRSEEPLLPPMELPAWDPRLEKDNPSIAQLWSQEWIRAATDVAARIGVASSVVHVIEDAQHQTQLRHAIASARTRLLVTSDRFSGHAVTGDLIRRLRAAAGRIESTRLVFGRFGERADEFIVDELTAPGEGGPVAVEHRGGNHAKILVSDEVVTIGSYNYLSFDGSFRHGRYSAELSVSIESAELADSAAGLYGLPSLEPRTAETLVTPGSQRAATAARRLERVFADRLVAEQAMAAAVRILEPTDDSGAPDITQVLAALSVADDRVREYVLATIVARQGELAHATLAQVEQGRRDLIESLWSRREWEAAAALAQFETSIGEAQRAVLLAAAATPPDLTGRMTEVAVLDDLPNELRIALAMHAVASMLENGELIDLREHVSQWRTHLSDDAAALVDAALRYWERYGSPRRELLLAEAHRDRDASVTTSRWLRLQHAVADLKSYVPKNALGEHVLTHMFEPDEEMGELAAIVNAQDLMALKAWAIRHRQRDDARWLDQMTRRAGSKDMLDGSRRKSFMAKRAAVRRLATDLTDESTSVSESSLEQIGPDERSAIDNLVDVARAATDPSTANPGLGATLAADAIDRILAQCAAAERSDDRRSSRFPRYWAAGFASGEALDLEARLAADLIDIREPGDEVDVLLGIGEIGLASLAFEDLTDVGLLPQERAEDLRIRVSDAVTDLGGQFRARRESLLRKAELAGLRVDLSSISLDHAPQNFADVDRAYAAAETRFRAELHVAQESLRTQFAGGPPPVIQTLIDNGELVLANHARRTAPTTDPWGRLSVPWKVQTFAPANIAAMLRMTHDRPRWIDPFIPAADDTAGWTFVDALSRLDRDGDTASLESYVRALHGLVSPRELTFFEGADSVTTAIDALVPFELRGIRERRFIATVAGRSHDSDLRISPGFDDDRSNGVTLDLRHALTILSARSREDRQLRLLRFLGTNVGMSALFDADRFPLLSDPDGAEKLRYLLLVRGVQPDPVNIERLLAAAGNHPTVLYRLIESYNSLIDPEGRVAFDLRPDVDQMIWKSVLQEDLGLPSTIVVLGIMADISTAEGVERSEIDEWLELMLPGAKVNTDDDLALLVEEHYVRHENGRYGLTNDTVGRALQRTADQWRPGAVDRLRSDLALGDGIDELRRVRLAQLEHARKVPLDQLHPRELRVAAGDYAPTSLRIDVMDVVYRTAAEAESADVPVIAIAEADTPLEIAGHPNYLTLLLRNALVNAVRAARGSDRSRVHVFVTADAREITIDVDDSGPGFGGQAAHGDGLPTMTEYARRLGGRWEPGVATGLPGADGLGGARISFVLPRVTDATGAASASFAQEEAPEIAHGNA